MNAYSYVTVVNAEPETINHKAPPEWVIRAVNRELGKRERLIQAKLINLYPLISFASLEPEFTGVFRVDLYRTIAGQSQLLLDRMREARVLLGSIGEDASVMSKLQDAGAVVAVSSMLQNTTSL